MIDLLGSWIKMDQNVIETVNMIEIDTCVK